MGPILPDQIVSDHLGGGPAAQETDVPDELGSQRQMRLQEISPLHGQVADLPSPKFPGQKRQHKLIPNSSHCMFMASCHLVAELLKREKEVNSLNYSLLKNKTFISLESKVGQKPKFEHVNDIKAEAPPATRPTASSGQICSGMRREQSVAMMSVRT